MIYRKKKNLTKEMDLVSGFLDFWSDAEQFDAWIDSLSDEERDRLYSHPAIKAIKECKGDILP